MDEGESALDPVAVAEGVLRRFLSDRGDRTLQAYSADIDDFARFLGEDSAHTTAKLLGAGAEGAQRLALEYALDLRQKGRAAATINRRLATLRGLMRTANEDGEIDWQLEIPGEDEVAAAAEVRANGGLPYLFPRHASEFDRLDVQHYALREALGRNYLAPVESPGTALDVGCGTGQWSFELCQRFPDAHVVGLDMVPSKPARPPGYHWVKANILHGIPLASERFDFVYQRLLVVAVPLAMWSGLVADLARVTRPGGWVELVEPVVGVTDAGPATDRFRELAMGMASAFGLDTTDVVCRSIGDFLSRAGLTDVVRQEVKIPIGSWGGRVGSFMATDLRAAQMRVSEALQARSIITAQEGHELIQQSVEECNQLRMSFTFAVAYGRKARR